MSKVVKELELNALRQSFGGLRDMVLLSISGLNSIATATFRANLRKKKIRLQVVKNTLTRRVFEESGIAIPKDSPVWTGSLVLAFGPGSIAEICRDIEAELKNPKLEKVYKDKIDTEKKGVLADGQLVPFKVAIKMPTRAEAIAQVLAAILGPASAIAGSLTAGASQVASQIEKISEKTEEPAPAATA
jgi:large subunit ribosomal protein L10